MLVESVSHVVDHIGADEGFVALDVDHGITGTTGGDFGDSVRAARVIGRGHFDPAVRLDGPRDSGVIGGNNQLIKSPGAAALIDDVLDQGFSRD
jgi:hypothetical protein